MIGSASCRRRAAADIASSASAVSAATAASAVSAVSAASVPSTFSSSPCGRFPNILVYVISTISEIFLRIDGISLIFEKNLFIMGNSFPTSCRKDFV